MPLSVIGAGLGRTGTLSLKNALELLGLGKCFHMVELVQNPPLMPLWDQIAAGAQVNWDDVFHDFGATVDWPSCNFYNELAAHYPDAKVILSLRDPDKWFDSTQNTIFRHIDQMAADPNNIIGRIILNTVVKMFGGKLHDRAHCIEIYNRHNAEVRRLIPPARLLVFDAAQGWEPLCRFLGKPIPAQPYPRVNSTEEFQQRFGGSPPPMP